jgi:hypothetical protein
VVFLRGQTPSSRSGGLEIEDLKRMIDAPKGDLFFLYWANSSLDMLAAKAFYDACKNPLEVFYELGDENIDETGCPRPEAFSTGKYLVLFGGPSVQPTVKYYEDAKATLVLISTINSTHVAYTTSHGEIIGKNIINVLEFDEHHDTLMMEFFIDGYGRKVFICYGWQWQGTLAAATYIVKKIIPHIDQYHCPFYIFRWIDTNNDYLPETDEVLGEKQEYVSVQAVLHRAADPNVAKWFADACHSRGISITWYVTPEDNGKLASILKEFMNQGDDIELSLGPIFFNQMRPEERMQLVNEYLTNFKRQFEFYPTLIEAYYIDAFTLNYIASCFPFIKGAVGYVNHEEFCDELKTAGAYYMPYYPSRFNALVPGKGEDKTPIVMLPFAHRDISNNILHRDVRYNLSPQDGTSVVGNWTTYFENLFRAYLNGWDQFGLAFYLIDLTYEPLPKGIIEKNLDFIRTQIESQNCRSILDKDFVKWFSETYTDSPCYRWIYDDPIQNDFSSVWYFTDKERVGRIVGRLSETRRFTDGIQEECYNEPVYVYDNSFN